MEVTTFLYSVAYGLTPSCHATISASRADRSCRKAMIKRGHTDGLFLSVCRFHLPWRCLAPVAISMYYPMYHRWFTYDSTMLLLGTGYTCNQGLQLVTSPPTSHARDTQAGLLVSFGLSKRGHVPRTPLCQSMLSAVERVPPHIRRGAEPQQPYSTQRRAQAQRIRVHQING